MRISTAAYFQTGLNSLNRQQSELMHVFQQVSSGKRMITPADDPLAAAQSLTLAQAKSMNSRFAENRQVAVRNLGEEENVLMSLIPQVNGAKTRLLEAANGTLSNADREALATVFEEMRDSIANLANAQDASGQYMFSGSQGTLQPFSKNTDGSYKYVGDRSDRNIQVDQTSQLPRSHHGVDVFLRATPGSLVFFTSGHLANSGTGEIGGVSIADSSKATQVQSIDIAVTAGATPDSPNLIITTKALDENGVLQETEKTVVHEAGTTRLDLGNGLTVALNGTPKAGDSFSLTNSQNQYGNDELNLLNTLNDVVNALRLDVDGNPANKATMQNVLNRAMQHTDLAYDNILTIRASVGARMNEVDALSHVGSMQALHLSSEISRIEDLDYYSASTQLEMRTSALEAAAIAFKKIQSTNLFALNARG